MARAATHLDRFQHERECATRGCLRIAGVDEAGRGPLAGPVVAAAVVFPSDWFESGMDPRLAGLNDSKQLSASLRDEYHQKLVGHPDIQFAVCIVDVEVIDRINILAATHQAMNEALASLQSAPDHVLVDGLLVESMRFPQTALVKGDSKSYSIAAASILAKVTRDRLMKEYDLEFPGYGFAEHKGYGTPRHLEAIRLHGPCPVHRRSFAPLRPVERELF